MAEKIKKKPSFEIYWKRIRNFPKYRSMLMEDFIPVAKQLYREKYPDSLETKQEKAIIADDLGTWQNKTEAKKGKQLYNTYRENYPYITDFADLENLKLLVNIKIQIERIQTQLVKNTHDNNLMQRFQGLIAQTLTIEKNLGLSETKKDNPLEVLDDIFERCDMWMEENQGSRHLPACPWCQKPIYFNIRIDKYNANKHPFFKDRILTNKPLLRFLMKGVLTKKQVAQVFFEASDESEEVSEDYIDWILINHFTAENPEQRKYINRLRALIPEFYIKKPKLKQQTILEGVSQEPKE